MTFTFRPARRPNTPLITGLAGPTRSGKTYSALRLAVGLAHGGPIAMINAEGAKGHLYAEKFSYVAADIDRPYRPARYTEALRDALKLKPAVVIIDSLSHMHDGPGGLLEYHEDELDRLAGDDQRARLRNNWTAWIKPKADENEFIYTMLEASCHLVLCFRAKEKIRIVKGKDPEPLGWQPIAGDRVTFETIFTLVLPPGSKGVPDLDGSEMREPFDTLIPEGKQLSEDTGRLLAEWAAGGAKEDTTELQARLLELAVKRGLEAETRKALEKPRDATWFRAQIAKAEKSLAEGDSSSKAAAPSPESDGVVAGSATGSPSANDSDPAAEPSDDSLFKPPEDPTRWEDQG